MKLYNWGALPEEETPAEKGAVRRRFVGGEQMTVARVAFSEQGVTSVHRHENEQFSMVLAGTVEFMVEGEPVVVHTGEVIHLAANELHGARALTEDAVLLDVFAPPRTDWGEPPAPEIDSGK